MNTEEREALWLLAGVVEFEGVLYKQTPESQANCRGCAFQHGKCDEFRTIYYKFGNRLEPACSMVVWVKTE